MDCSGIKYYVGCSIPFSVFDSTLNSGQEIKNIKNNSSNLSYDKNSLYERNFNFYELDFSNLKYSNPYSFKKNLNLVLDDWIKNSSSDKLSIKLPKFLFNFDNSSQLSKNDDKKFSIYEQLNQKNNFEFSNDQMDFLDSFFEFFSAIRKKILAFVILVPENLTLKDGRFALKNLLEICKSYGYNSCVEYFHPSWFQDLSFNLLKNYNSAIVWSDKNIKYSHNVITSNFIYLCIYDKRKLNWWLENLERRVSDEILDKKKISQKTEGGKDSTIDFIAISCSDTLIAEHACKILDIPILHNEIIISHRNKPCTTEKKSKNLNHKSGSAHKNSNQNRQKNIVNDNISNWTNERVIVHVDLNSFYPSCEELRDFTLRGKPHAVIMTDQKEGEKITRGVVASCSYAAKKFGVKSAMPLSTALKICPNMILKKSDIPFYRKISKKVMNILESYADILEQASIDEAYLDCTEKIKNFANVKTISGYGNVIKKSILKETGLLCSVGISKNKSVAKIASDFQKPDGLTVVTPDNTRQFLYDLEVERIPGVGIKTQKLLSEMNIKTIGQLSMVDVQTLAEKCGKKTGIMVWTIANGKDQKAVEQRQDHTSISIEHSLRKFTTDKIILKQKLCELVQDLYKRIHKEKYQFRTIGVKLVKQDFSTETREISFSKYQNSIAEIEKAIPELLDKFELLRKNYDEGIKIVNKYTENGEQTESSNKNIKYIDEDKSKSVANNSANEQFLIRKIGLRLSNLQRISLLKESKQKSIKDFF